MSSYLAVFLAPRMLAGLAVVLVLSGVVAWSRRKTYRGWRRAGLFGFLVSVGVVLLATLLREPPSGSCPACLADWHLARFGTGVLGTDVALNVVLFAPPVLLATLLWRRPVVATLVAAAGSLAIEVLQPLLGVGANDAMDLLANTAGAVLGATAGAALLLVRDVATTRRLHTWRLAGLALTIVLAAAVGIAYPSAVADAKQSAADAQLQELFAGTTLADYRANRDGAWDAKLLAFSRANGPLTTMGVHTDQLARERFSWSYYFATRCVVAEWTPSGFTTLRQSGGDCTATLHP